MARTKWTARLLKALSPTLSGVVASAAGRALTGEDPAIRDSEEPGWRKVTERPAMGAP